MLQKSIKKSYSIPASNRNLKNRKSRAIENARIISITDKPQAIDHHKENMTGCQKALGHGCLYSLYTIAFSAMAFIPVIAMFSAGFRVWGVILFILNVGLWVGRHYLKIYFKKIGNLTENRHSGITCGVLCLWVAVTAGVMSVSFLLSDEYNQDFSYVSEYRQDFFYNVSVLGIISGVFLLIGVAILIYIYDIVKNQ